MITGRFCSTCKSMAVLSSAGICAECEVEDMLIDVVTATGGQIAVAEEAADQPQVDVDIDRCIAECIQILKRKGDDYTIGKGNADRLYNFTTAAVALDVRPEQVLWIYFFKHLTAIQRWCKEGKLDSEGIKGRIHDAINYLLLLYKMVCEKERGGL